MEHMSLESSVSQVAWKMAAEILLSLRYPEIEIQQDEKAVQLGEFMNHDVQTW